MATKSQDAPDLEAAVSFLAEYPMFHPTLWVPHCIIMCCALRAVSVEQLYEKQIKTKTQEKAKSLNTFTSFVMQQKKIHAIFFQPTFQMPYCEKHFFVCLIENYSSSLAPTTLTGGAASPAVTP